jgi:hypothetical protein
VIFTRLFFFLWRRDRGNAPAMPEPCKLDRLRALRRHKDAANSLIRAIEKATMPKGKLRKARLKKPDQMFLS